MGFWSTFGRIASMAAPFALAPFTAGTSLFGLGATGSNLVRAGVSAIPNILGDLGRTSGAAATGRAEGRIKEGELTERQDQNAINLYNAQQAALQRDLDQRKFLSDNYQRQAQNAIRGGALQGVQDLNIQTPDFLKGYVGQVSGGLRPSAIVGKEAIGDRLQRNALIDLMDNGTGVNAAAGSSIAAGMPKLPTAPGLTPLPQAGAADSILSNLGTYGSISGSVMKDILDALRRRPTITPMPTLTGTDWMGARTLPSAPPPAISLPAPGGSDYY